MSELRLSIFGQAEAGDWDVARRGVDWGAATRSTKIVATIGPSSREPVVLEQMIHAGMDMARLNFAHGDPVEHAETAQLIRAAAERAGREVAILGDIPGPKLRIGPVGGDGVAELGRGTSVVLTADEVDGSSERLPVAWRGFSELVDEGDVLYLADGAVRLRVSHVAGSDVVTQVEVGGSVASRQGLNLPNVTVSLPAVSDEDIALVDFGIDMGLDYFALSFVRRREDLEPVREHLRSRGSDIPLIAKVEKPQAAANADEIVDAADGIMIARGDLGIELPIEEVPLVQKRLLALAGRRAKPDDHGHADARVDGPLHAAHARRGGRRGQRDLRRHRRRDALPGDGRGPPSGAGGRDDGQHRRRAPSASCPTAAGSPSAARRRTTSTTRSRSAPWAGCTSSGSRGSWRRRTPAPRPGSSRPTGRARRCSRSRPAATW